MLVKAINSAFYCINWELCRYELERVNKCVDGLGMLEGFKRILLRVKKV